MSCMPASTLQGCLQRSACMPAPWLHANCSSTLAAPQVLDLSDAGPFDPDMFDRIDPERVPEHLRRLALLLQALPAAAPGLTQLVTNSRLPPAPQYFGDDDDELDAIRACEASLADMAAAAGCMTGLVELHLHAVGMCKFSSCQALRRLRRLVRLDLDATELDIAHLPVGLTALTAAMLVSQVKDSGDAWQWQWDGGLVGRHDEWEWAEWDEEPDEEEDSGAGSSDGEAEGQGEQEEGEHEEEAAVGEANPWGNTWLRAHPRHRYAQLRTLVLRFQEEAEDLSLGCEEYGTCAEGREECFGRHVTLARLQPLLQHVTELQFFGEAAEVMCPTGASVLADAGLPPAMRNCCVLAQLTTLQALVLEEPWPGIAEHLAPLQRLTRLGFAADDVGSEELEWVVEAAVQLPQLRVLDASPEGGWPERMLAKVKERLPVCEVNV